MSDGFISLHRKIQKSTVSRRPPCTRESWQYLLLSANHSDRVSSGRLIHRGQLVRTYKDIQNALSWKVGYRAEMYSEKQIGTAFKHLRDDGMITTQETAIGQIITICNYNKYQNPENLKTAAKVKRKNTRKQLRRDETQNDESLTRQALGDDGQGTKADSKELRRQDIGRTINNNKNNGNNEIKNNTYSERQKSLFLIFQNWVDDNCKGVAKMKQTFTIDEYFNLKKRAGTERLYSIVEDMENWEGLKNNSCAYKTFLIFFKKQGGKSSKLSSIPKLPPEEQQEAAKEMMMDKKMVI